MLPEEQFPRVIQRGAEPTTSPAVPNCHRHYAREYFQKGKRRLGEIRKARRESYEPTAHELLKRTQAAREREALGDDKKC